MAVLFHVNTKDRREENKIVVHNALITVKFEEK